MILDEGCKMNAYLYSHLILKGKFLALAAFAEMYGSIIASPGIAEKGSSNVRVQVTAPGGHSSIPPAHTVFVLLSSHCLHSFDRNHSYRALASSPRSLYTTNRTLTMLNLSVIANNLFLQTGLTH